MIIDLTGAEVERTYWAVEKEIERLQSIYYNSSTDSISKGAALRGINKCKCILEKLDPENKNEREG
jgi:hypothetical protein